MMFRKQQEHYNCVQDRKQAVRLHAIHAMHERFELADTNAAILVDATNAFNSLNRENALRNIQY